MEPSSTHRAGYRRGFVLGLTLAETALLLLFVILLLLVVGFSKRDGEILIMRPAVEAMNAIAGEQGLSTDQVLSELKLLDGFKAAALRSGRPWDENFLELVRDVIEAGGLDDLEQAMRELEQQSDTLKELVNQLDGVDGIEELAERLEAMAALEGTVRNQRGRLAEMQARLNRAGQGLVFPSCWSTEDGRIEYFADVALESTGIRARETIPERRREERDRLDMAPLDENRVYRSGEFLSLTEALYRYSLDNECRFYVTVYDNTLPEEKERFIDLMLTVEGRFYKRQMRGRLDF